MTKDRTIGFVYAIWTGILWGASSPVAQYLFEAKGIESSWLAPYRLLISGFLLFACAAARRPWRMEAAVDQTVVIAFLAIVILGTVLPFCFYLWALTRIGAVYTGLMTSIEPVTATVLAAVFLGTAFEAIDVVGFVLVLSTGFILNIQK